MWAADDGALVHAIRAPGPVHGLEFLADDPHLLVTLEDGDTFEYTLDPDELLEIARSRISRGFTEAECRAYDLNPCPTLEDMLRP